MTATNDIRQRVLAAGPAKRVTPLLSQPPAPVVYTPVGPRWVTVALGACILIMSVAIFFVVTRKAPTVAPVVRADPPAANAANFATKADLAAAVAQLSGRMDKSDKRIDLWAHRVWLLGVANNENAALTQQRLGTTGYILFDENWKLNQLPKSMQFDPQQQKDLVK